MAAKQTNLRVAIPKGKVQSEILALLGRAGFGLLGALTDSRKLFLDVPTRRTTFLSVRDRDIPTFVEYGVCDLGLVGKDVLLEQEKDVYEPLDTGVGGCRLVWAAPRGFDAKGHHVGRIATKYPRVASRYFEGRGQEAEIVELYGSIELAPYLGLADSVVDLVSTGGTLRGMGLREQGTVAEISTWLIVNRAASKLRSQDVTGWVRRIESAVSNENHRRKR